MFDIYTEILQFLSKILYKYEKISYNDKYYVIEVQLLKVNLRRKVDSVK